MESGSVGAPQISARLQKAAEELRQLQNLLVPGAELAPQILVEFRDALNRVRTAAWAMAQYAESQELETDPASLIATLAGERIRTAYQLCRQIQADLDNAEIKHLKGPLLQLHEAVQQLSQRLDELVGK